MTFEELEQTLPNGFHDGAIRNLNLDFVRRSVVISLDILAGQPEDTDPERYRAGRLQITPVFLFFVEPPDPRYAFIPSGSPLKIDGDSVKLGQNAQADGLLPVLPPRATTHRFFIEKWNSYLYVAGGDVQFSWDDEREAPAR